MKIAVLPPRSSNWRRRPAEALIIFGCWTLMGTISVTRHYMEDSGAADTRPVLLVYVIWLTCYWAWALLTPAVFNVAKRWPLTKHVWQRNFWAHLPLSIAFTTVQLIIAHFMNLPLQKKPLDLGYFLTHLTFTSYLKHVPLYFTTVAVANLLSSFRSLREKERLAAHLELERSQLETSLRQAQLDALRMQLNPHFLFNTLQNISVLMMDDTAVANRMLIRLSDLLRSTLRSSVASISPLRDEVAFLRAYLEIEQIRFADRLRVIWDLEPGTESALIPTLLLQPLAENSIRHGIARLATNGTITITSRAENGTLYLSVADSGPGLSQQKNCDSIGHGIGLNNTRKRLKQLYPEHEMEICTGEQGGFEVKIRIPLTFKPAERTEELVAQ